MTTTAPDHFGHAGCTHPATFIAKAACRAERRALQARERSDAQLTEAAELRHAAMAAIREIDRVELDPRTGHDLRQALITAQRLAWSELTKLDADLSHDAQMLVAGGYPVAEALEIADTYGPSGPPRG